MKQSCTDETEGWLKPGLKAMKGEWEEVPRGDMMPQYSGVYVTMNPKGDLVMNRVAYELTGGPDAFVLLFDKTNRRIGLKPASKFTRNAYPVCVANRRSGSKKVHGHRLTKRYRIDLPQTIVFPDAEIDDDGILRLDLRTAEVPKRVKNHYRNRKTSFE
jgi:hypothetical protein